jgi:hypothetical protein
VKVKNIYVDRIELVQNFFPERHMKGNSWPKANWPQAMGHLKQQSAWKFEKKIILLASVEGKICFLIGNSLSMS